MLVDKKGLKLVLSCSFLDDVLCPYRKTARPCLMERCWKCRYFNRFNRDMLAVDEKVMDEIDEERRTGFSE